MNTALNLVCVLHTVHHGADASQKGFTVINQVIYKQANMNKWDQYNQVALLHICLVVKSSVCNMQDVINATWWPLSQKPVACTWKTADNIEVMWCDVMYTLSTQHMTGVMLTDWIITVWQQITMKTTGCISLCSTIMAQKQRVATGLALWDCSRTNTRLCCAES